MNRRTRDIIAEHPSATLHEHLLQTTLNDFSSSSLPAGITSGGASFEEVVGLYAPGWDG